MTGAEAVIRCLELSGVEVCFGIPGGAILPRLRRPGLHRHPASSTCWCATSRAPATWPRATPGPPAGSAWPWPRRAPGPRTSSPRSPTRSSTPRRMVVVTGQVRDAPDRHRRLPGGRHHGHLHAGGQALLPGPAGGGPPADVARGVPPRPHRAPGAGAGRHPEGRANTHASRSAGRQKSTCPATSRRGRAIRCRSQRGGRRHPPGRAARPVRRRRRGQRRGGGRAAGAGRGRRHPRRDDADGQGRVPRLAPAGAAACRGCTARATRTGPSTTPTC